MIEKYFIFKMWSEFIVPVIAFVVVFLWVLIAIIISSVKEYRKEKFLTGHGFEKRLHSPRSGYGPARYKYVYKSIELSENKVLHMKYKELVKYVNKKVQEVENIDN